MKSGKLFRRWRRQLALLLGEIDQLAARCKRSGDVEDIHVLRVAMRRARVFSRVGVVITGKPPVHRLALWSQRLTSALGAVRDLDITLTWLAEHPHADTLAETCRQLRSESWQSAAKNLTPLPKPVSSAFAKAFRDDSRHKPLHKKYLAAVSELEALMHQQSHQLNRLSQEEQHQFRRALRRYRYLVELGLPKRKHKTSTLVERLIRFQKILGEMQDRAVIERVLQSLEAVPQREKLLKLVRSERKKWLLKSKRVMAGITQLRDEKN